MSLEKVRKNTKRDFWVSLTTVDMTSSNNNNLRMRREANCLQYHHDLPREQTTSWD